MNQKSNDTMETKLALATDIHTDKEVLDNLSHDRHVEVVWAVLLNESTSAETIINTIKRRYYDNGILCTLAFECKRPEVLRVIAEVCRNGRVLRVLASNPNTPADALSHLANLEGRRGPIIFEIYRNPNTPKGVKENLKNNKVIQNKIRAGTLT